MTEQNQRTPGTFVVDGAYLRAEAREAFRTFFAPFTWPFMAVRWVRSQMAARKS